MKGEGESEVERESDFGFLHSNSNKRMIENEDWRKERLRKHTPTSRAIWGEKRKRDITQ